jgi:hypothetical protein
MTFTECGTAGSCGAGQQKDGDLEATIQRCECGVVVVVGVLVAAATVPKSKFL